MTNGWGPVVSGVDPVDAVSITRIGEHEWTWQYYAEPPRSRKLLHADARGQMQWRERIFQPDFGRSFEV